MFKNSYCIIIDDGAKADMIMKLAANHNLHANYKIGVYGNERQHEIFVYGRWWDYYKLKNELTELGYI